MSEPPTPSLAERVCGDCAMCCHLGEIVDFKPYNQWCQHCSTHQGCDIYETRPILCRQFYCAYMQRELGEEWYPLRSHMVVSLHREPKRMTVLVDPETPMVWQEARYFRQLQAWAQHYPVTVMVHQRAFAVYPQHVEDLGELGEGQRIEITETETMSGIRYRMHIRAMGG